MTVSTTLTSYIITGYDSDDHPGGDTNLIQLSYADLDFTPSASDSYKSTSGDILKVYVDGIRIYRAHDETFASGSGFLEDGDNANGQKLNSKTVDENNASLSWSDTNDNVWSIDTSAQTVTINISNVHATNLYHNNALTTDDPAGSHNPAHGQQVKFTSGTSIIELRRAVQDLKTPAIDFSNASILTEQDLDNSAKNVFHISQQAVISTEEALLYDSGTGTYKSTEPGTSTAKRISSVATPVNDNDATNKAYVDGSNSTQTVAGLSSEIALLGTSAMATATTGHIPVLAESTYKAKVETVADATYKTKVEAVAGKETEIERLGTTDAVADLGALGDTAFSHATTGHLKKVSDKATEVATVAAIDTEVGVVGESVYKGKVETVADSAYKAKIETVADSTYKTKVETVADSTYKGKVETVADSTYKAKVETVAGDTTAINSVYTNIADVNNFANTYHTPSASSSAPSSNVTEGDLWYQTDTDKLKVYNGTSWVDAQTTVGSNSVTSTSGDLTLSGASSSDNVVINTGSASIKLPNARASTDNYVLAMSDTSDGSTAWQATATSPTITSISGALNHDQDSTLTLFGADFKEATAVSLWNASSGGSQVGSDATITNQTGVKLEATFGHGDLNVGATLYVEADNSGISTRFTTAFTVSADPTVTFTQGTGSGANTTNHLGTYGGRIGGGPQDSNTKLLLNFDRGGGTDIEDSSNTGGEGHKVTANGNAVIRNSPFLDTTAKTTIKVVSTGGYLYSATDARFDFQDSSVGIDFCLDFWLFIENKDKTILAFNESLGSGRAFELSDVGGELKWIGSTDGSNSSGGSLIVCDSSTDYSPRSTWNHIAVTCKNESNVLTFRFFCNGIHTSSFSLNSGTYLHDGNKRISLGTGHAETGGDIYMDEVRFVAGETIFPQDGTNFTPSTVRYGLSGATHEAATASNVKFLLHSNNSSGGGTTFTDSSSSPLSLSGSGSPSHSLDRSGIAPPMTWPTSNKKHRSSGCYFDGDGDYAEIDPFKSGAGSSTAFSMDFWFNQISQELQYIIDWRDGSDHNGYLYTNDNLTTLEFYGIGHSGETTLTFTRALNTWYHFLYSRDATGNWGAYINGIKVGNGTGDTGSALDHKLTLCKWNAGANYYFDGYIDNLRMITLDVTQTSGDPLYTGTTHALASTTENNFVAGLPTKIYGAYKDRTIPTGSSAITFTGQLASGSLASDEDIEFSNVANASISSGMQKLDDSKIGLTLTNLTGSDKNKATLTGTISDNFSGTTRANLPVKAQVRTERGNATYDSTGSSKRLVTFSSSTNTEGLQPGYTVTGTGIPAGTTITSIDSATTLTLSADTTGGALTSQTLHFGDPERQIHVNGSEVLENNDAMLTIAVDSETKPTLFNARRYMGSNTDRELTGFGFSPDLCWIKDRTSGTDYPHELFDTVRGAQKGIQSNATAAEVTHTDQLSSFNKDGVGLGDNRDVNGEATARSYIAWAWKAGGAPTADNDNTDYTSTVDDNSVIIDGILQTSYTPASSSTIYPKRQSINTTGGFSITQYVGISGYPKKVPHGLGSAPHFVLIKNIDADVNWSGWHTGLSSGNVIKLNLSSAQDPTGDNVAPDGDNHINLASNNSTINADGVNYIMYAWKAVANVSAFGTSTGGITESDLNNSTTVGTDGYCGFQPRMIIIKSITTGENWHIYSEFQSGGTTWKHYLFPNTSDDEQENTSREVHVKSSGFYIDDHSAIGGTGSVKIIWAAFA